MKVSAHVLHAPVELVERHGEGEPAGVPHLRWTRQSSPGSAGACNPWQDARSRGSGSTSSADDIGLAGA